MAVKRKFQEVEKTAQEKTVEEGRDESGDDFSCPTFVFFMHTFHRQRLVDMLGTGHFDDFEKRCIFKYIYECRYCERPCLPVFETFSSSMAEALLLGDSCTVSETERWEIVNSMFSMICSACSIT